MNNIQVNPDLSTGDKVGLFLFIGFFCLLFTLGIVNALNRYLCQNHGTKCLWCKKFWVGLGCGCIPRGGKIGTSKDKGSKAWSELTYPEKLYHTARFTQREYLRTRREGLRTQSWCWQSRRDAYLHALRYYKESEIHVHP